MPKPVIPTNAFAVLSSRPTLLQSCHPDQRFCSPVIPTEPQASGGILPGFCIAGDLYSKPGKSLCERIPLTFTTASRCLHSLRSVDMTVLASGKLCFTHSPVIPTEPSGEWRNLVFAFVKQGVCFLNRYKTCFFHFLSIFCLQEN